MILQQAAICCDALIAFRINEWTPNKTDQPQKLLNLIKVHTLIHEFIKVSYNYHEFIYFLFYVII